MSAEQHFSIQTHGTWVEYDNICFCFLRMAAKQHYSVQTHVRFCVFRSSIKIHVVFVFFMKLRIKKHVISNDSSRPLLAYYVVFFSVLFVFRNKSPWVLWNTWSQSVNWFVNQTVATVRRDGLVEASEFGSSICTTCVRTNYYELDTGCMIYSNFLNYRTTLSYGEAGIRRTEIPGFPDFQNCNDVNKCRRPMYDAFQVVKNIIFLFQDYYNDSRASLVSDLRHPNEITQWHSQAKWDVTKNTI